MIKENKLLLSDRKAKQHVWLSKNKEVENGEDNAKMIFALLLLLLN